MNTPSIKWRIKRVEGPIGIHCDARKSVPDPFPSVKRQASSGKVLLEYIVTLQNLSQIHSQVSSGKVPLEYIVTLQNWSQIHSQVSSSKVPLECIVMLQNRSEIHSQASSQASKLQSCRSVCSYP